MKFKLLVNSIQQTHTALQQAAVKAINKHLTIRNWLIGYYIVEFEQNGDDRARYGTKLLSSLSKELSGKSVSNSSERELRRYRKFYQVYFHFATTFFNSDPVKQIRGTLSPESQVLQIRQTLSPELEHSKLNVPVDKLISKLSFSHLLELIDIEDPLKRTFYELECIKGTWSLRELRRQINSLCYERSGLSRHPGKLSAMIAENTEPLQPVDIIKSVYTFEFLGLNAKDVVEESDLETSLLNHLQQFMLELGHGFCLEARQKKILIGEEYNFIDLVFYHRILKCHVLLELKIEEFNHINIGQLNTYLNYYKAEIMHTSDQPPVGILLVTNKNEALVQYATAGMDNHLFVSKYLVQLPGKVELENFIKKELKKL